MVRYKKQAATFNSTWLVGWYGYKVTWVWSLSHIKYLVVNDGGGVLKRKIVCEFVDYCILYHEQSLSYTEEIGIFIEHGYSTT